MGRFFYYIGIKAYGLAIHTASLFSDKAKLWVHGRRQWKVKLKKHFANNRSFVVWLHCASLGEFEQGRPLIEEIKKTHPNYKILLSFFSPSGYELGKNYALADWTVYLPIDSPSNAKWFIEITKPKLALFIKYEFWYYYLSELKRKTIPTYLVSAHFRSNQIFFKWYGGFFRNILGSFTHLFVQEQQSLELLKALKLPVTVAGDTRVDRAWAVRQNAKRFVDVEQFINNRNLLVAGSTWARDESNLLQLWKNYDSANFDCMLIAPHHIDEKRIEKLEKRLGNQAHIRYSRLANAEDKTQYSILIIDNIGMLSSLYRYAKIAYVGGGFGAGIHNILEAVIYELPVIFGPQYQKFQEALDLSKLKIAYPYKNPEALEKIMRLLDDSKVYEEIKLVAADYIKNQKGATTKIMRRLALP